MEAGAILAIIWGGIFVIGIVVYICNASDDDIGM